MGRHRGGSLAVRPRYRRITAAGSSALVTLVAVLGAGGVIPGLDVPDAVLAQPPVSAAHAGTPAATEGEPATLRLSGWVSALLPRDPDEKGAGTEALALPARSGEGRRIVFDMSDQRVWLVSGTGQVARTYLVSGSLTDNLDAGSYRVYSRSRHAVGVDDSGTMGYMVRFAHGASAAIGFHDIPVLHGDRVQSPAQLGTPQSHGCIRQRRVDAKALWSFAPVGTRVVVLA